MNNGTSEAVLVRELLDADGPHGAVAEHFVALRCVSCGSPTYDEARYYASRLRCLRCLAMA